jgi:leucyl/phenylalanyl-tRNA---protein transferase
MANRIPAEMLLGFYGRGLFPMALDGDLRLFSPDPRGIIPLEGFRVPHGARKTLADPAWEIRLDTSFGEVLRCCADRESTWIDETIMESYLALHEAGHAHSVEVWRDGGLAGGLYGVRLGGAFFGESMFHRVPGASKVALNALVAMMRDHGFTLLDTQWVTPHLAGFGAIEVPREDYLAMLSEAIRREACWPSGPRPPSSTL